MTQVKTKEKIIFKAVEAYNQHGMANVTSRFLANELGISHGNLEYYFPTKEDLLLAIYQKMRKNISAAYANIDENTDPMLHFHRLLLHLENFQAKYSFFNLDVLEITRNYPKIKVLLDKTFLLRKEQIKMVYDRFTSFGYLKEELLSGMYLRLLHTIRVLITFWKPQEEVMPGYKEDEHNRMSFYIWSLVVPHLTPKGLRAYNTVILHYKP